MQRILSLFDGYFFIMILIAGIIVTCIDTKSYEQYKNYRAKKQAKVLGSTIIILSLVLYLIGHFVLA